VPRRFIWTHIVNEQAVVEILVIVPGPTRLCISLVNWEPGRGAESRNRFPNPLPHESMGDSQHFELPATFTLVGYGDLGFKTLHQIALTNLSGSYWATQGLIAVVLGRSMERIRLTRLPE
jgi:hypothetical protein